MSITPKGIAVVTGAAQGIGRAIALRLARDGYDLSLNDLTTNQRKLETVSEEILRVGRRAISFVGDVSEETAVKDLVSLTAKDLGSVDVMVANAGIEHWKSFIETDTSIFDKIYAVNVRGAMFCYKYAALQMIKQGRGGRIIGWKGAASLASKQGTKYLSAYSASKFALRGLTQCAAQELGKYGITVNTYAPGIINTRMLGSLEDFMEKQENKEKGHFKEYYTELPPIQRLGQPEDVASIVSFLASKDASFITGQSVSIDGGLHFD